MAEEKNKRIVIASVLKPVNDTRMFGKLAVSIASTKQYEVHVIGFTSSSQPVDNVIVHPLGTFNRISIKRVLAEFKVLLKILAIRPALLIITTHELLFAAAFARLFCGCKLIYDVQENYFANILHTKAFPFGIRHVLALYVRAKEVITSPLVNHYFLAEKAYEFELGFPGKRHTVLENKVRRPPEPISRVRNHHRINLLFSGTLAETTGVFIAIDLALLLQQRDPRVNLTIIGHAPDQKTLEKLRKVISRFPFITLVGGDRLVPHSEIISEIMRADFGIISHPANPSTRNRIPTKLYEYLGYRLPFFLINHGPWITFAKSYHAAIVFDPASPDVMAMLESVTNGRFFSEPLSFVFWEDGEPILLRVISALTGKSALKV